MSADDPDDHREVEALVRRWAQAVHTGDLETVVADHDDDIVMFDVPPPHTGVRGLAAYRDVWPDFFAWQAAGATFDVEELDVTTGADVGFAWATVRCGTAEDHRDHPDRRLRLTLGLRRVDGRWRVTHEHHSFAHE